MGVIFTLRSTMLCPASLRRIFTSAIIIFLVLLVPVAGEDNGTITLRLEMPGGQMQSGSEVTVPSVDGCLTPKPCVSSAGAVLMDAQTGQVLYSKNPDLKRPNASTTKIMTAILIIENCKMTDKITASKKASETPYTSLHLKPGEKILVKDLLFGMLIRSANDAAVAAAEHIAGSTSKFAKMMNEKAAEIGCKNTHFVTPNGLYDKNHYSTAYDLCLMAKYALRYPIFNEVVATRKYMLSSRTLNKEDLAVFNLSKFLKSYPGADGVKSGYIKQAGNCYVGSATRNGWRLVSAVLKSGNANADTAAMMDYGFNNYQAFTVAQAGEICSEAKIDGGSKTNVAVAPAKDLNIIVPNTGAKVEAKVDFKPVEAPITKGTKLGTMTAIVNGKRAATVELRAAQDVGISFARRFWTWTKTCFIVLAVTVVGRKYGTTFTKNTSRRRRRIASALRDFDRYR